MRIDHQQWLHQHQKQKSVHPYHFFGYLKRVTLLQYY